MNKKHRKTSSVPDIYSANRALLIPEVDNLYSILNSLRHEGRPQLGKNLRRLNDSVRFLDDSLRELMAFEEKCLFPYTQIHIPRLQPLIFLLCSEHEDFRRLMSDLQSALSVLRKQKEAFHQFRGIQKIEDKGAYLVCLLRSHLWAEDKKIYDAVRQELRSDEKKKLATQIFEFKKNRNIVRATKTKSIKKVEMTCGV